MSSIIPPCESEDWTYPVNVTGWRVEQINVYVDGGQLDVYVTNSVLDVNVTNSELNVNVTNAVLDVNITNSIVPISIDNATITVDVATIKERASETGNVYTENTFITASAGDEKIETMLESATGEPLYVEMLTACVVDSSGVSTDNMAKLWFEIVAYDEYDTPIWIIYAHMNHFPINFDPALKIPKNGYLNVRFHNGDSVDHTVAFSVIFRY